MTFDGLFYSFQTAGEFVLVKNTDGGTFQVQARLSAPVGASIYSVITEVGVQVGRDVVTIDSTRAAPVWVDGEAVAFSGNSIGLADGGITRTATGYVVTLDTGESVTANINSFGTQTGPSTTSGGLSISVSLAPDAAHDSVEGLLGNYNGNPNNDLTLANGTVEPTDMSSATLYGVYADSWRVTQATSLLNYGPGQTTATFTDTGFPETPVSISSFPTAEVAAATQLVEQAGITDPGLQQAAIYDYLVTGDPAVVSVESNLQQQGATTSTQAQIAPSTSPSEEVGVLATTMSEAESASGTTTAPFDIYREGDTSQALVVNYSVTTPGSTYLAASDFGGSLPAGQVTLEAGQTLAPLSIVIPDGIGAVPTADLAVAITAGTSVAVISPFAQETIVNAAPVAGPQPAFGVEIANESSAQPLQSGNSWRFDLGAFKEASATSPGTLSLAVLNLAAAGSDSMEGLLLASDSAGLPTSATSGFEPVQPGNMIDIANIAVDKTSLGVNTEQFVITPYDLNASGYVAIMAQQTVTVTDTVYPLAQALLSTTTIDFGVVRGGSVEQQAIGIENHGPVGAEALDAGVGALTGAATGSGSFTLLAVGQTSTAISVGLNTSGGGVVTGTAAIDPYSDGANTDGLGATALLPQAVTVSGTVYREAQAGITLVQPILHVGDSGTDALIVSNVDPADGYSENLIATLAGATGGFSSAGTGPTGDVAAGSTNSTALAVTFSTSQAGTISGAVTLDVTTDGGTGPGSIDGFGELARAPETFALSATIDNYATAEIVQLSGPGMLSASGDMFRLDFGKVGIGSAPESVDLGLENAASATADLLAGSFVASGDPALVLSGFSAFAGVAAQQILSGLNVTLDTNQAGLFTQVITLDPTGYNASGYEGALAPEVITVAGTVDNGPTLAPGMLTIGHGQSEMVTGLLDSLITPGLPGDSETIVAVSGNAALANGVVTYAAPGSGPDSFTYQVEDQLGDIATGTVDVTVDPGPVAATGSLTVGHGQTVSLTSLIDGLVTPGLAGDSETISAVSAVSGEISLSPAGAVTYEAPAGGSDTVDYTATDQLGDSATGTVAVTIDPGPMARTLDTTVTLGAAVNLTSAILGVVAPGLPGDMLLLSGDGTLDTLGTVTLASGQLTYTAGGEVLNQIPANGSQADSFTYTVTDEYGDVATGTVDVTVTNPAVVIDGPILGFGTIVAAPRATIVNAYAFDNVIFDEGGNDIVNAGQGLATVYVNTGNAVVNLSGYDNVVTGFDEPGTSAAVGANGNVRVSGSQGLTSVDLGNGNDTVLLGGSFNVITLGNGADSVNAGQGFGTIRLGNGNDQVTLGGLANSVVAGDGNDAVSGSQGLTSVTLGNGTENVLLVGSGNLIQVGNGNDTIVAGSGSDQVVAGSGNDTITLQGRSNVVTLSAGSDTIQAGSADTITLDSARLLLSGGSQEMVFLGSGAASLDDLSSATTLAAGPSSGSCDILDFAHDTGFVLDLTGGVGGYTSVAQAISALQSDGDGGTQLLLGSGPGAAVIDFVNTRASGLTPNHFRIG